MNIPTLDRKKKALDDYVRLESIENEVSKRANGNKKLLQEMVAEKKAKLQRQIMGPSKFSEYFGKVKDFIKPDDPLPENQGDVIVAVPRSSSFIEGFDLNYGALLKYGAITLTSILLVTSLNRSIRSGSIPNPFAKTSTTQFSPLPVDSRRYFDMSLFNKFMIPENFPNHMVNPQTNLERIISQAEDPALMYGLIEHESAGWDPEAKSNKDAVGLVQMMFETANEVGPKLGFDKIKHPLGKDDWRLDPEKSAKAGIYYFEDLKKRAEDKGFKDVRFAIAAYNCGFSRMLDASKSAGKSKDFEKVNSYLPSETQTYVEIVMEKKNLYEMVFPMGQGEKFKVVSLFGKRKSPFDRRKEVMHRGDDFAANKGKRVVSSNDGVVIYSGSNSNGYGTQVWIRDDHGNIQLYGHMSGTSVKRGQKVKKGDEVGKVGTTGRSTGNHLHYGLFDMPIGYDATPSKYTDFKERAINPMRFFNKRIILKSKDNKPVAYAPNKLKNYKRNQIYV